MALMVKVAVENLSDSLGVLAAWDGDPAMQPDLAFADPRAGAIGWRMLVPAELAQKAADAIARAENTVRSTLRFMFVFPFPL